MHRHYCVALWPTNIIESGQLNTSNVIFQVILNFSRPGQNPFYSFINSAPDIRPRRKSIPLVSELTMAATKRNAGLPSAVPRASLNDEELVSAALCLVSAAPI
ncbi:hypothetical protein FHG87_006190 [Trinorchestia longiramus]|nr:hypothetical protein FHG87_006190 [Trinorchestia longiramus]